jgi:hypothetical protein
LTVVKSPLVLTRRPGERTISLDLDDSLMQGDGQIALQAFTRHFQNIADADFAGSRFQIQTGAAMQVENIALRR